MLSNEIFKHLGISEPTLKHHGIKGMRWGVIRNRNRPGGADGKEESTKVVDKRGKVKKKLDSMQRERQWHKVLKNVHQLNTTEINAVTKRIQLENSLKNLSKSKIATKKDKEDYLRREHMSDAELNRKVVRLRAKDGLHKAVKEASKEQRDFGEKVVRIGGSIGVKYAITRQPINAKNLFKDVLDASKNPRNASDKAKTDLLNAVPEGTKRDVLSNVLNKIDKPDKKK